VLHPVQFRVSLLVAVAAQVKLVKLAAQTVVLQIQVELKEEVVTEAQHQLQVHQ
jgi:hypothetical protein